LGEQDALRISIGSLARAGYRVPEGRSHSAGRLGKNYGNENGIHHHPINHHLITGPCAKNFVLSGGVCFVAVYGPSKPFSMKYPSLIALAEQSAAVLRKEGGSLKHRKASEGHTNPPEPTRRGQSTNSTEQDWAFFDMTVATVRPRSYFAGSLG
jgi:hypothetical protein